MNCVLGQTIVGLPELLAIPTEGLCRIERVERRCAEDQREQRREHGRCGQAGGPEAPTHH